MRVREVESTVTQKVYELTEDELNEIKDEYFNKGINVLIGYITYCLKNSRYVFNHGYCLNTINRMVNFFSGQTNIIENKKDITFQEFIDGKR